MPTIFAANESVVLLNGDPVEGVRSIDYRFQQVRQNLYALGSAERVGMTSGPQAVEARVSVASTSSAFNGLTGDEPFQVTAQLRQGETEMTVTFDDCFLTEKSFEMGAGGHGEALYGFSAARVREQGA